MAWLLAMQLTLSLVASQAQPALLRTANLQHHLSLQVAPLNAANPAVTGTSSGNKPDCPAGASAYVFQNETLADAFTDSTGRAELSIRRWRCKCNKEGAGCALKHLGKNSLPADCSYHFNAWAKLTSGKYSSKLGNQALQRVQHLYRTHQVERINDAEKNCMSNVGAQKISGTCWDFKKKRIQKQFCTPWPVPSNCVVFPTNHKKMSPSIKHAIIKMIDQHTTSKCLKHEKNGQWFSPAIVKLIPPFTGSKKKQWESLAGIAGIHPDSSRSVFRIDVEGTKKNTDKGMGYQQFFAQVYKCVDKKTKKISVMSKVQKRGWGPGKAAKKWFATSCGKPGLGWADLDRLVRLALTDARFELFRELNPEER